MNNDEMLKATLTEEELNARYPHVNRAWKVENLQFYIICARPTELPEQSEMLRTFCEIFKDAECVKYEGNVAEFSTGFCGNERVRFRVTAGTAAPELTDLEWSDTWKNEDAEGIMNRCQHSVLVEEVDMASYGKQKLGFEINLIGLTDKMFRQFGAKATLFRPSGRLTETEYIREYFEDPMKMLHHTYIAFYCHNVVNVRYAEEDGCQVVDTLGLGVLGYPDINFYFRKTDKFEVMNLCDTTASTLVNSDWPVEDGGRIPNFRTGKGDFECHYVSAFLAPMREVLDITVDSSFPKVFMNCPPTTSAQGEDDMTTEHTQPSSENVIVAKSKNDIPEEMMENGKTFEVKIPDGCQFLSPFAFAACPGMTSVSIPNGIEEIYSFTFKECPDLESISLPSDLKTIDDYAFMGCKSLAELTLPEGAEKVGVSAFEGCTNLTKVTFPRSIKEIGYCAFSDCSNLTQVVIPNEDCDVKGSSFPDGCKVLRQS